MHRFIRSQLLMLNTDQHRHSTKKNKTQVHTSRRSGVIKKTESRCVHNWSINLLFLQFGLDGGSGDGWESGGWAHGRQANFL